MNESIAIICKQMNVEPRFEYGGGTRGWIGDSPKILLDASKLRALGWKPTYTLEQSIIETVKFLDENPYCDRQS